MEGGLEQHEARERSAEDEVARLRKHSDRDIFIFDNAKLRSSLRRRSLIHEYPLAAIVEAGLETLRQ